MDVSYELADKKCIHLTWLLGAAVAQEVERVVCSGNRKIASSIPDSS